MSALGVDRYLDEEPSPQLLPALAGMLTSGVVAWLVSPLPSPRSLSLFGFIVWTAGRSVIVAFAALATVLPLSVKDRRRGRILALDISISVLWLVPLAVLIRERSAWAVLPAAALAVSTTRSLFPVLLLAHPADVQTAHEPFGLLASSNWSWRQPVGIVAALVAQVGLFLGLGGYTVFPVILTAASAAVWAITYYRLAIESTRASRLSDASRALLATAAILLAFGALVPYLRIAFLHSGSGDSAGLRPHRGVSRPRSESGDKELLAGASAANSEDGHVGIILLAREQIATRLVAPPPVSTIHNLKGARSVDPLVIPFDGVYWVYKAPDTHPPQTSRQAHGSPELFNIRSTDRRPLTMEAHQNFGSLIDLSCCSRIQIAIENRDRYPETVSLELILIDSSLPGKPSQSLGRAVVRSTRPWRIYEETVQTSETLDFAIPARPRIREFDEVMIVFHLDSARSDYGARIAINRLVLLPRGA